MGIHSNMVTKASKVLVQFSWHPKWASTIISKYIILSFPYSFFIKWQLLN